LIPDRITGILLSMFRTDKRINHLSRV